MPKTCNFLGRVTMYSDHAQFPGPKVVDLSFDAVFDADQWSVTPAAFGAVKVGQVSIASIPVADLVVTLVETAQGTADRTSGAFTVQGQFAFSLGGLRSILRADFDCVTPRPWNDMTLCGRPYDSSTGQVMLSALGQFEDSLLDGKWSAVIIEGMFRPKPW
ncbi:MAG: hypothetical protein IT500_15255 [Rubrivivax sp.]|nr:hypothetical protein [Rubrivivax sp.]